MQSPRMITPDATGLLRVAWMPNDEVLLRAEAGVLALQPMELSEDEDIDESTVFAFEPPSLASLRCDVLRKTGDLEGEPQFVKDQRAKEAAAAAAAAAPAATPQKAVEENTGMVDKTMSSEASVSSAGSSEDTSSTKKPKDDPKTIGDVLQL